MVIRQATPPEAYKLIADGYRYIDVRTEAEFGNGHPATALNIPVVFPHEGTRQMVVNPRFLSVVEGHFAKDDKIIVGCQSGGRSQKAADLLDAAGYKNVVNMRGGFGGMRDQAGRTLVPGWSECGLPVCRDCGPETSYSVLRSNVR